jgi:hypothetical protein
MIYVRYPIQLGCIFVHGKFRSLSRIRTRFYFSRKARKKYKAKANLFKNRNYLLNMGHLSAILSHKRGKKSNLSFQTFWKYSIVNTIK